ncbi:MAG: SdiA-regulated domain-containing protein [Corticimicrobacter sp.]|uniref:SdiA-regulated domain-containing protein n=1 Tax=Corticimicrobacter sp. TaxID=2678536 RepID=UPI0032DBF00A
MSSPPPASKRTTAARLFARILIILSLTALLGGWLFYAIRYQHLHDTLITWFQGRQMDETVWNDEQDRSSAFWLPDYRVVSWHRIPEIDNNLSGLSFVGERQELLAVLNRPPTLVTLDLAGNFKAAYPLEGISDTEGISYLGHGQVALSDEKHGQVVIARLPEQPGPIDLTHAPRFAVGPGEKSNSGIEGLSYDRAQDRLYAVKEHSPKALYRIDGLCRDVLNCSPDGIRIHDLSNWLAPTGFARDFSAVQFDPARGHLLLLSEQSQALLELDENGQPLSARHLGHQPGDPDIPQAEGLTLGQDGMIYMVSEPNLFYRLAPIADTKEDSDHAGTYQ